jgi:hypothetical protein
MLKQRHCSATIVWCLLAFALSTAAGKNHIIVQSVDDQELIIVHDQRREREFANERDLWRWNDEWGRSVARLNVLFLACLFCVVAGVCLLFCRRKHKPSIHH